MFAPQRLPRSSARREAQGHNRPDPWLPRSVSRLALPDPSLRETGLSNYRARLHGLWQDGKLYQKEKTSMADRTMLTQAIPSGLLPKSLRLRLPRPRQRHRRHRPPHRRFPAHPRRPRLGRRGRLPRRAMVPVTHRRRFRRRHAVQRHVQDVHVHGGAGEGQTAEFRVSVAVGQRGGCYGGVHWG